MKRILMVTGFMMLLAGMSRAQLIRYENFGATSGNQEGAVFATVEAMTNNWVTGYTAAENPLTSANDLAYGGFADPSGNGKISVYSAGADRGSSSMSGWTSVDSGSYYCSFLIRVTSTNGLWGSWATTNNSFISLRSVGANNAVGIRAAGSGFELGFAYAHTDLLASDPQAWFSSTLNLNTTYLIVYGAADVTVGNMSVWINPSSLGGSAPTPSATITGGWRTGAGTATRIEIGSPYYSGNDFSNVYMDELRIGTTWAAVTPQGGTAYTLTVNANPGGSATGGGLYAEGQTAQITATPSNGFVFVNWTGAVTSVHSTTNVLMTTNKTVWANFGPAPLKATTFVIE